MADGRSMLHLNFKLMPAEQLSYSNLESNIFGYSFYRGRFDLNKLDQFALHANIAELGCDVLRLKILGDHPLVFSFLNKLGLPYEIYNINYLNRLLIQDFKEIAIPDNIKFRQIHKPSEDESFAGSLGLILDKVSWVEYENDLIDTIMPADKRKELAFKYYLEDFKTKNLDAFYASLQVDGQDVGVVIGAFEGDSYIGSFFGLLPNQRNQGWAKYFYQLMIEECRNREVKYFENEVNLFNISSQASANSRGITPKKFYFNVCVYPLLNLDQSSKEESLSFPGKDRFVSEVYKRYPEFEITQMICGDQELNLNKAKGFYVRSISLKGDRLLIVMVNLDENGLANSCYVKLKKKSL